MNFDTDFTSIGVENLKSGMLIDFSIYYPHQTSSGTEYLLLCKNTRLTDELIKKFKIITAPKYKIYVPNENFEKTFKENFTEKVKKVTKDNSWIFEGYEDVKTDVENLFNNFSESNYVSAEMTDSVAQKIHSQINSVDVSFIIQCINSIRKIDKDLYTHSVNVALLNGLIGKWIHLDEANMSVLVKIGLLHDIGKLSVPPIILNKPGRLTPDEFEIVKMHSVYSYVILTRSGVSDDRILQGIVQHHEKMNGQGYPLGLSSDKITIFARITSIADVYDAMVTKRVYKNAHSPFEVLAWFAEGAYSDLDINYVNIFLDCMIQELKGKKVVLSDGSVASVLYVHTSDFAHPIVQVGNNVIQTTSELHCVSMYNDE